MTKNITKKQFKTLERLNDIVNTLDIFSDIDYEQRIRNRYYNKLLMVADNLSRKLLNN
jgi:hypothetical protein